MKKTVRKLVINMDDRKIKQKNIIHSIFSALKSNDIEETFNLLDELAMLRNEPVKQTTYKFIRCLNEENLRLIGRGATND